MKPVLGSLPKVPVRVFLLDDHEIVRLGLRTLIAAESDLVLVGEAGTGPEALAGIAASRPDVAVIDLQLEDGDGIEVCREIRERHPEVRCLVLTAFAERRDVTAARLVGAVGYVLKQRAPKDFVEAVRTVAAGGAAFGGNQPRLFERSLSARGERSAELLDRLSAQERRILVLLAEGQTNRQIGAQLFLAENTVKNYVSHLLTKLGMARRSEAAAYAARLAALEPEPTPGGGEGQPEQEATAESS